MMEEPHHHGGAPRRMLPPLQEVIFYANFKGTPFTTSLPPLRTITTTTTPPVHKRRACEHKSNRIFCKKCDGSGICQHGKSRFVCLECGGNAFCKHRMRRYLCKECKKPPKLAASEGGPKLRKPVDMNAVHAVAMLLKQNTYATALIAELSP